MQSEGALNPACHISFILLKKWLYGITLAGEGETIRERK
jgi:hypothetical protein